MSDPLVSVVIPTTGRPELIDAIASVRAQTLPEPIEVIVVWDGESEPPVRLGESTFPVTILRTGGRRGAPVARNTGVRAARGEWVAFLDDDDRWLPDKLHSQLVVARQSSSLARSVVVSGRVVLRDRVSSACSRPIPGRLISEGESLTDYLFRARSPSVGRASLFTSTLLADRELCRRIPWADGLRRHQDWDWLMRAQAAGGARVVQLTETVAEITVGSVGSISASPNWQASLKWAQSAWTDWPARTRADFVAAQPLRYALTARSFHGVTRSLRAVAATRRLPSPGPLAIGMAGIAPRRILEKVLTRGSVSTGSQS